MSSGPKFNFMPRLNQNLIRDHRQNEYVRPSEPTTPQMTEEQIDKKIKERFKVLDKLTDGVIKKNVRSLIVSGPPGLGKSYTIEKKLNQYDPDGDHTRIIKGFSRATGLYKSLYMFREKHNVLVFDDCDSIFFDPVALNLLKTACDTTEDRILNWGAETKMTTEDGENLPTRFQFDGKVIFATNTNFDRMIRQEHRLAEDFKAMISRSFYVDLAMNTTMDYIVRIKQVIKQGMLRDRGISSEQEKIVVDFLIKNKEQMRELTLRMAIKLGMLVLEDPDWEEVARVTLMKQV